MQGSGKAGVSAALKPHTDWSQAKRDMATSGPRAVEVATAAILAKLDVWTADEIAHLKSFQHEALSNWNKIEVGVVRASG